MSPILLVVIGLVALGVGILIARWFARANPAAIVKALRWTAIAIAFVVVAFVMLRFAPQFLPVLLVFAVPFLIMRWVRSRAQRRPPSGGWPGGAQAGTGQASNVETSYLRMTLDHQSGEMSGEVLRGRFAGRPLSSLGKEELLTLLLECQRDDPPSVRLVESYLDRTFGTDWRTGESEPQDEQRGAERPSPGDGKMTRAEALEILGLAEGADRQAVLDAWRRLIKLNHPDHGGSKYIAAKLNEAKRVLIGE
ncbi:MAG: molecular chaperone DnaJ [Alphaproteobacteria bacterium]